MDTEKIETDGLGFYWYRTEDFATISLKFAFSFENTKESIVKARLLSRYMKRTNSKYRDKKEIKTACRELYGLNFRIGIDTFGTKTALTFSMAIADPRIIGEDFLADSLEFLRTIISEPAFKDGKADEEILNSIKIDIFDDESDEINTPSVFQSRLFFKKMLPESDINNSIVIDMDEFQAMLDNIDGTSIYEFYRATMKNFIGGYAFGNLTREEIEEIRHFFPYTTGFRDFEYANKEKLPNREDLITDADTSQSYLYVAYDIKDYTSEKKYLYETIEDILNSTTSGFCLQVLRTELGIVYHASATALLNRGIIYICAQIDRKNREIALKGIDKIYEMLQDEKAVSSMLEYVKEKESQLLYTNTENLSANIDELDSFVYRTYPPEKTRVAKICELTAADIVREAGNLEKCYQFFYEGVKK